MAVNYAEQYSAELANAYPYVLYFGALWNADNKDKYKVVDAKTIKIPKLSTGGRVDGDRNSITQFTRNWDNSWETKVLTHHRTWQTLAHPQDISQTNTVASIANITKVMNETQKFPEMDCYMASRLYTLKNEISPVTTVNDSSITVDNVLVYFDSMMTAMDEECVPPSGRILYCDTYIKNLIKDACKTYRANGDETIKRSVAKIDEVKIESVPTKLLKTKYDFSNGWAAEEDALSIRMMLVHPSCILPVVNYAFAELEPPSAMSQGKYVYFEESFEDVFILNEKHHAIQMLVSNGVTDDNPKLKQLNVTSAADNTTSGSSKITVEQSADEGNKFVYKLGTSYAPANYDSTVSSGTWKDLPEDGVIACGTATKITVLEVDEDTYKVKARGIAVLTKKA